jgi:hypothetical protein
MKSDLHNWFESIGGDLESMIREHVHTNCSGLQMGLQNPANRRTTWPTLGMNLQLKANFG